MEAPAIMATGESSSITEQVHCQPHPAPTPRSQLRESKHGTTCLQVPIAQSVVLSGGEQRASRGPAALLVKVAAGVFGQLMSASPETPCLPSTPRALPAFWCSAFTLRSYMPS
ncbi:hypothetical protein ACJJTC_008986 [Scirpophaga incertulas]